MEMMFLIVKLGYGSVVIPEKYSSSQCLAIAETINKTYSKEAICVPASVFKSDDSYYNCQMAVPDATQPGRYVAAKTHCDVPVSK